MKKFSEHLKESIIEDSYKFIKGDGSEVGIQSKDEPGAIIFFKNKAAAQKAAKDDSVEEYMEMGMDSNVSWGAEAKKVQKDMKANHVTPAIIKLVTGSESGE